MVEKKNCKVTENPQKNCHFLIIFNKIKEIPG